MNIEIGSFILQGAISIGGAFLAAYLATKNFRSEKWWEKKVDAYTGLIEALHTMKLPASEHLDAEYESRVISEEDSNRMWEEYKEAHRHVWQVADSSTFLVSEEVVKAVQDMERDLTSAKNTQSWIDHLEEEYDAIDKCLLRIKEIGKIDLGIKRV
jgi:hypothetical protein